MRNSAGKTDGRRYNTTRLKRIALLLLALAVPGCGSFEPDPETWGMPEGHAGRAENSKFSSLVEGWFAWYYAAHPVRATYDGIHDYDDRLQDLSAGALAAEVATLRRWLDRARAVDRRLLSRDAAVDHEMLEGAIRAGI